MSSTGKPKIAISACLLGENVRFNGGHKQSLLCSQTLADYFEFVPLCPEVAIGLGIPREPIRLVGDPAHPQAVGTVHRELNVTQPLDDYGQQMASEHTDLCGYIFMQKSPSCGLERVKVYRDNGTPAEGGGRGIYAQAFCARHPNLPVEEDGRLNDPVLRENFLTRVFVYASWQQLLAEGLTRHRLLAFHSRYKYLLMAHSPAHYKSLGHLLGSMGKGIDLDALAAGYFSELMTGLKKMRHPWHSHQRVAAHQRLPQAGHQRRRQAGNANRHRPIPPRHRAAGGAPYPAQTPLSPTPGSLHRAAGLPATAPGKPQPA